MALIRPRFRAGASSHRLVNRGVGGGLDEQGLVKPEAQNIARRWLHRRGAEFTDPEIEQAEIAQDAVEKLEGKGAIGRAERAARESLRHNLVGEFAAVAPAAEGVEGERAAGLHGQRKVLAYRRERQAGSLRHPPASKSCQAGLACGRPIEV